MYEPFELYGRGEFYTCLACTVSYSVRVFVECLLLPPNFREVIPICNPSLCFLHARYRVPDTAVYLLFTSAFLDKQFYL